MNYSTHRFALDLHKAQSQISIAAFQDDTAVKFSILITDGGAPYRFEDGVIAVLWGTKANGEPISHACSIESNTRIIYEFNKTTTNEIGIINCQIRFYKEGEQILSAPKFTIVVSKRIGNDDEVLGYEYEDEGYEEYFKKQFSSLNEIISSESDRKSAENARIEAEEARVGAETERKDAEKARADAEIARDNAETERQKGYAQKVDKTELSEGILEAKTYADTLNSAMGERVSDLESLTLTHFEEENVSYKQAIPTHRGVLGSYATLKSVGGMSKFDVGKNKLNPYDVTIEYSNLGTSVPFTVDDVGDISFDIYYEYGLSAYVCIDTANLEPAEYALRAESTMSGDYQILDSDIEIVTDDEDLGPHITVFLPEGTGENTTDGYFNQWTFRLRLMVDKIGDSDTLKFVGKRFDDMEYEKYKLEIVKADVSIDSIRTESASKNELDPHSLEWHSWGGDLYDAVIIDDDGSIAFTIPAYEMWYTEIFLDPGIYRYKFIGTANGENIIEDSDVYFYVGPDRVEINFNAKNIGFEDAETGEWRDESVDTYYDIKLMVYKEEDLPEGIEFEKAPASVNYEPYEVREVVIDSITLPQAVKDKPEYALGFVGRNDTWYTNKLTFVDKTVTLNGVCGVQVFKGTENWIKVSNKTNVFQLDDALEVPYQDVLTSEYDSILSSEISKKSGMITNGMYRPQICDKRYVEVEDFKQHLANNPLTVLYGVQESRAFSEDVTNLFTDDNLLKIAGAEDIRFTNAEKFEVENTIAYTIRKE